MKIKLLSVTVLVIMAMTMIACPGAGVNGKHGINGKNGLDGADGTDGADGADGADGKNAPIITPLWLTKSDNTLFPISLEDHTGGKLTTARVDMFQDALYAFSKSTTTSTVARKNNITGTYGSLRFIIVDTEDYWPTYVDGAWLKDKRNWYFRYSKISTITQTELNSLVVSIAGYYNYADDPTP